MKEARLIKISNLTDRQLYRSILRQASLLSIVFQDPILFLSHSYLARLHLTFTPNPTASNSLQANSITNRQNKERSKSRKELSQADQELRDLGFDTSIEVAKKRRRIRVEQHLKGLSSANLGYVHSVNRCINQAYGRRGKIRHELLAAFQPKRPLPQAPASKARLHHPLIFPSLRLLLLSLSARFSKSTKIQPSHLEYPPISFLPIPYEQDAQRQSLGEEKRISKRREANARWRWVETVFDKIRGPLCFRDGVLVESKKLEWKDPWNSVSFLDKQKDKRTLELDEKKIFKDHDLIIQHLESMSSHTFPISGDQKTYNQSLQTPTSLRAFREAAEFGTPRFASTASLPSVTGHQNLRESSYSDDLEISDYKPSVPRKLRGEGWKFSTVDFTKDGRARRRKYGSLLAYVPVLKKMKYGSKNMRTTDESTSEDARNFDPKARSATKGESETDSLSPFSPSSTSQVLIKRNSSKSPFETKHLAEMIDELNNPDPIPLKGKQNPFTTSSPSSSTQSSTQSKSAPAPKGGKKVEFVYSKFALHPANSEHSRNQLETKKSKLWVDEEDIKILSQGG